MHSKGRVICVAQFPKINFWMQVTLLGTEELPWWNDMEFWMQQWASEE